MKLLRALLIEEEGQGLVEYSLIIALIALVAIASLQLFGVELGQYYENIKTKISEALTA